MTNKQNKFEEPAISADPEDKTEIRSLFNPESREKNDDL